MKAATRQLTVLAGGRSCACLAQQTRSFTVSLQENPTVRPVSSFYNHTAVDNAASKVRVVLVIRNLYVLSFD